MKRGLLSLFVSMLAATAAFAGGGGGGGGAPPTPFTPPLDAMDTLNSGSATGGLDSGTIFDRVRSGLGSSQPGSAPPPASPFGDAPPAFGGGTPPPAFGGTPQGMTPGAVPGLARSVTAIGGMRIISRISGEILQDGRTAKVTSPDTYFDDGVSGGDAVAGDGVYTNLIISSDFISPGEFLIKTRALNGMKTLDKYSPQEFFGVRVATTEPVSSLPKLTDLEEQRDTRLRQISDRFLRDFRVEPDNPGSPLVQAFIPAPPKAPNLPLPATFSPRAKREKETTGAPGAPGGRAGGRSGDQQGVIQGKTLDDDVTGTPIGGASSRYF